MRGLTDGYRPMQSSPGFSRVCRPGNARRIQPVVAMLADGQILDIRSGLQLVSSNQAFCEAWPLEAEISLWERGKSIPPAKAKAKAKAEAEAEAEANSYWYPPNQSATAA